VGQSLKQAYSHANPADGIFADGNPIGCGYTGMKSSAAAVAACNADYGVNTPNSLFVNPPGVGPRFGELGRNVFRGPWFNGLDAALLKNFKVTEAVKMQLRFEAIDALNHPNFDFIDSNLNDGGTFGKAQGLVASSPSSGAISRRIQLGVRITF
jgi:hypothetical protein